MKLRSPAFARCLLFAALVCTLDPAGARAAPPVPASQKAARRTAARELGRAYGSAHWEGVQRHLDQLVRTPQQAVSERLRLMGELSSQMNVLSLAGRRLQRRVRGSIGPGNCGFVAFSSLLAFARGALAAPIGNKDGLSVDGVRLSLSTHQVSFEETPWLPFQAISRQLKARLREGQLGLLNTYWGWGGHYTVVVKMGGKLFTINNSGWDPVSTLAEWNARAQQVGPFFRFRAFVTDLEVATSS